MGWLRNTFRNIGSGIGDAWDDITGVTAADRAVEAQSAGVTRAIEAQETGTTAALEAQQAATTAALAQQQTQFDAAMASQREAQQRQQALLQPFYDTASSSLGQMSNLSGLGGEEAQQAAISGLENSPMFQSQLQQQENALLQNASATGGLRGGNTQAALAQFRPAMLQQQIQQQMSNLGGIANMGMNPLAQAAGGIMSAGQGVSGLQAGLGQGAAGLLAQQGQTAAGLYGQQGMFQAGMQNQLGQQNAANQLARYQMPRDFLFDVAGLGLDIAGLF